MIYYGNGKIEWEESIFLDEDGRHKTYYFVNCFDKKTYNIVFSIIVVIFIMSVNL